jgi:hypothetical protein
LTDVFVSDYDHDGAAEWDELIAEAPMATFLHSRRFLSYHGDRFADRSLVLRNARSRLVGVFPAAADPSDDKRVVSHPGSSYGGVLHTGSLGGAAMIAALTAICDHYAGHGFRSLRYKPVPHIYHRRPAADDVYALTYLGAQFYRCDLSCAIDLADRARPSERRRRGERKAREHGVVVAVDADALPELWHVLEENLSTRHVVRPTHTVEEMRLLLSLFPESIRVVAARLHGEVVAGLVLFISPRVVHAQYIASSEAGREVSALDAAVEHCISLAASLGASFFDFGISTEADGRVLNAGLHTFKSEFGGGGVVHTFHDLDLSRPATRPTARHV